MRIFGYCVAMGESFSPGQVEAALGVRLSRKVEIGDVLARGRRAGEKASEAVAQLNFDVPRSLNAPDWDWDDVLDQLAHFVTESRRGGAVDIATYILVEYDAQCNIEISAEHLARLASLRTPLALSAYSRSEAT